jgi:hypothetical protein
MYPRLVFKACLIYAGKVRPYQEIGVLLRVSIPAGLGPGSPEI